MTLQLTQTLSIHSAASHLCVVPPPAHCAARCLSPVLLLPVRWFFAACLSCLRSERIADCIEPTHTMVSARSGSRTRWRARHSAICGCCECSASQSHCYSLRCHCAGSLHVCSGGPTNRGPKFAQIPGHWALGQGEQWWSCSSVNTLRHHLLSCAACVPACAVQFVRATVTDMLSFVCGTVHSGAQCERHR
jgi:hypothetical protein